MTRPSPDPHPCPRCGALSPTGAHNCPRCLFELALRQPEPADGPDDGQPPTPAPAEPTLPTAEEVARALPQFQEVTHLGRGGMGAVFRARESALDREVAIKVLPRELGERADFRERFLREARALARLQHPNVVSVHGAGESQGLCYLVMEYVSGCNLRQRMRTGPIGAAETLRIVRELCEALQFMHDEGVVHRDIKPENVLLDGSGRVKLADLGLAKLVDRSGDPQLTRSDQVMGTPHYMAPEQLERPHDVDHRADLFALGVILYELLTGSLPRGAFELPSRRVSVDVRLDEIVLKALEREPARRYQHALEVKGDVERLDEPIPELAHSGAPGNAAPEPRAALGRVFLAAMAAFAGYWSFVAWTWNQGPFGLASSSLVLLGLLIALGNLAVRKAPDLRAALRARSPRAQVSALAAGALACLLGLAAIALGHLSTWESGVRTWHPAHRGADGLAHFWQSDPWGLLRFCGIDPSGIEEPRVGVVRSAVTPVVSDVGGGIGLVWIAGGMLLVLLAARALLDAGARPELSRVVWNRANLLGAANAAALLALWTLVPFFASPAMTLLSSQRSQFAIEAAPSVAVERLIAALEGEGLQIEVHQEALVNNTRSGESHAEAYFLRAAPASPFKTWKTSPHGARRVRPQLWATVSGAAKAQVHIDAGLYQLGSPEYDSTGELLDRLRQQFEQP